MTLQFKIPLIFFSLALLLGAPLLLTVKGTVHQIILQDVGRKGVLTATALAEGNALGFEAGSERLLLPALQTARERTGAYYAIGLGPSGEVLAHTNVNEKGKMYADSVSLEGMKAVSPIIHRSEWKGVPVMEVSVPVWAARRANTAEEFLIGGGNETSERVRLGTVRLGLPLQEALEFQYRLFRKIAAMLLITGGIGLVLSLFAMRRLLLPIKFLSEATSRISQGEYGMNLPVASKDELGHLADDFNHMSKTLAETTVSKDHLSGVLDNLADPLIITAPDTTIRDVNPAALYMLGYSQNDVRGKPFEFLFPQGPSPLKTPESGERLRQSVLRNIEVHFRTKQGDEVPVLLSSSVLKDPAGKVTDIIVTARDMTERKRLESIVRQSDKLSAVGQLAAGVAHEINNPLGVILGFVEAIDQDLEASDPLAEPMKAVIREALRCKTLVQNLLTFSRQRQPGMTLENPPTVVENALSLVETQTRVRNVEVVREFAGSIPLTQMDRNQIEQVVINLCTNAMDAMPKGGRLTIGLSQVDAWLEIRVADTGMGISPDLQLRIFEPFFSTKEIGKGTGLGLSLVYETVKKHHGTIELKSEVGQGALFIVRLPLQSGPSQGTLEGEGG